MAAILLPFAVQFVHSFEHHCHEVCTTNDLHIDEHKEDCSVFHFKINQNSIDFPSEVIKTTYSLFDSKIITSETKLVSTQLTHKSSRAPPILLF
ncbi:hypothetical protein SAMN05444411_11031 [Lutibacter oricola]|uniref:Uncharacterized protein n=1 Tax=Lutibacter oricola TaxID=762486 RepID=A0A1H3EWN0_9FLAO|nr:hypothetical protein [Lutibacter oricola]SDX82488.1 hypothetical protein SAMN05444411_11031 [Lutibacter oricola]